MARRDTTFELHAARTYPVVVLISAVDSRILPALRFVANLPFAQTRALHVSVDPDETRRIAHDWMELGLAWLPLHITEASNDGIAASVRAAVEESGHGLDTVTIVVPELNLPRWWHSLLHRHSARRIAAQLQAMSGLTTVIVPFCVPIAAMSGRTHVGDRDNR
jgi:hypothetical protein